MPFLAEISFVVVVGSKLCHSWRMTLSCRGYPFIKLLCHLAWGLYLFACRRVCIFLQLKQSSGLRKELSQELMGEK